MSLQKKVTVITGAGRGIGRATALRFAHAGARVVLFSRTQQTLDEAVAHIRNAGGQALAVRGDVAREEDVQALFQQVIATYGGVDILVNCAGVVAVKPFPEMDTETWDRVLNTNVRGTFLCCLEAFNIMGQQQAGVILNISSLSGVKGVETFPG
jgi:NAD(P)-dependent dehydrogenase (short-subunit alcohol dehydrogenase family)